MWLEDQIPALIGELLAQLRKSRLHRVDHAVVGKLVRVTDRIPPGGLGAVIVPVRGGTEEFYARSDADVPIDPGRMVTITAYLPPRTVEVKFLDCFTLPKNPTPPR